MSLRISVLLFSALALSLAAGCKMMRADSGAATLEAAPSALFFTAPDNSAMRDLAAMGGSDQADAKLMRHIAVNSVAVWYVGGDIGSVGQRVKQQADAALAAGKIAVMVVYNIPHRDCGSYSAGGAEASNYLQWISTFASNIGAAKALIILEPDATVLTDCLSQELKSERANLLKSAIEKLKTAANAKVYLDVGHANWLAADVAASKLLAAGVAQADGFSINVSNFVDDQASISYGQKIRAIVGKNFIIDSSRNGKGSASGQEWCNPKGRALGRVSTVSTGVDGLDAFVWVKLPGESDGSCNGGPGAGQFSRALALELARNATISPQEPGATSSSPADQATPTPPTSLPPVLPQPGPTPATPQPGLPSTQGSGNLVATLKVKAEWDGGYCADLVITNHAATATKSWTITLAKNGSVLSQMWNLSSTDQGTTVIVKPVAEWNRVIAPGQSNSAHGICTNGSPATAAKVSISAVVAE